MNVPAQRPHPTPRRLAEAAGRLASLAALALLAGPALGQSPTGGQVVHGSGSIHQNGNNTVIHAGNGAIFNWQSFNVGQNQSVQFVQPGATSRVLNRITGPDPSVIAGRLSSNGIVYIANPAGVFFANGALVNVGGIYAAAGKISNADFLSGNNRFTDLTGVVENRGTINGGTVGLIGQRVANFGVVNAPAGMVTMAAGDEVYVGEQNGQIFARVSGGAGQVGVTQAGEINAPGGQVRLGAGDMYAMAIDHPGRTVARDIKLEGGRTGVVAVSGTLDASDRSAGGVGGTVSVLGDKVGIFGGEIDASGDAGGGRVLVGGNWQGQGPERNANATYLSVDASIKADAVTAGNGGTVVVWSDRVTRAMGDISARGGALGGDGGRVETSGKFQLQVGKTPDVTASRGRGGLWLIDPHNVTIVAGGGNTNIPNTSPFEATGDDAQLGVDLILAALTGGASVSVTTGTTGTQDGDITLATNLDFNGTGTNTLTLDAARDIILNGSISDSAAGGDTLNLVLNAGRNINANDTISLGGGDLTFDGAAFLNSAAAIDAGEVLFTGPVVLQADTTIAGSVSVTFESTVDSEANEDNDLIVNSPLTAFRGSVGAGTDGELGLLQTDAAGSTTLAGAAVNAGTADFQDGVLLGGATVLTATTSATFASTIDSEAGPARSLTINSPLTTISGEVGGAAALDLFKTDAAGATTLNGDVSARRIDFGDALVLGQDTTLAGSVSIVFRGTVNSEAGEANDLTLNSPVTNFNGQVGTAGATTALGAVATDAAGLTTINTAAMKADTFDFADAVQLAFDVVITGATSVAFGAELDSRDAQTRDLTVNSPLTTFGGVVGGTTGGALGVLLTDAAGSTVIDAGAMNAQTLRFNDAVRLDTGSVLTGSSAVVFNSTLNSQTGESNDLTINAPQTTFGGVVGGTDALGTLATDDAGSTTFNTSAVSAAVVQLDDAVVIGEDLTVTGSTRVAFGAAVNSQSGEANDLTVNSPNTTFTGAVGAAANGRLGALVTDAAGTTTADGEIRAASVAINDSFTFGGETIVTTGDQVYGGAVKISVATTLTGANLTFNGTVDSALADRALTLNTQNGGVTRFNAAVGSINPLASLTTNADGQTIIAAGEVTTSGDQTYNDVMVLAANTAITGRNVLFGETVDSDGTARTLSVSTTGSGTTTFSKAVGATGVLASLSTNSDGTTRLNGGSVRATGSVSFNDAVILGADTTVDGQSIAFGGTLNSDFNTRSLVALTNNGGATTFAGAVGGTAPLRNINTNADGSTQIFGGSIRTTGNQNYRDAVVLGATATITGANVAFFSTIDSTPLLAAAGLTVNTTGSGITTFRGDIGATNALLSVATDPNGTTRIGGDITTTTGGMAFGDTVRLFGDSVLTDAGNTGISFGNTLDSEGTARNLTILTSTTSNASTASPALARIVFGGNVGSQLALQSLTLGGDRSTTPAAATIGAGLGANGSPISNFALTINTNAAFTMGARQKFSVLGNLTVNSGGTATLGDISTLGNMTINAPAIVVNTRPGGDNLSRSGSGVVNAPDLGVDYVAGGSINFSATPTVAGGFARPAFATPESSNISPTLSGFTSQSYGPVGAGEFNLGTNYLDLRSEGPTNTNVATALAGALPSQEQSGVILEDTSVGRAQQEELLALGISARSREQQQILDLLGGGALYYDIPPSLGATDVPVTISRLPAAAVRSTLAAYRAVFYRDGKLDTERPRQVLGAAWKEYSAAAGEKADPLGFRAYVEAVPAQAEALYFLDGLRDLFAQISSLGLSPGEVRTARNAVLRTVTVPGLPAADLEAAIVATNLGPATE